MMLPENSINVEMGKEQDGVHDVVWYFKQFKKIQSECKGWITQELFWYITISFLLVSQKALSQENLTNLPSNSVKALVITYDVTYPNGVKPAEKYNCYNKRIMIIHGLKIVDTYLSDCRDLTFVSNDCNESYFELYPNQYMMIKHWRNDLAQGCRRTIESTNVTKHILDIECKEYLIRVRDANTITDRYAYTCEFEPYNSNYSLIPELKGLVLGFDQNYGNGIIQRFTAKSVTEQFVDSTIFNIPKNYVVLTQDEYFNKWYTDKTFRKSIRKEFKLDSGFQLFLKALLKSTPIILQTTSKAVVNISNIKNGNTVSSSENYSFENNSNANSEVKPLAKYQARYNLWASNAQSNYTTIKNALNREMSSSNEILISQARKLLLKAQKNMREVRSEAARNGVSITVSLYEDISL